MQGAYNVLVNSWFREVVDAFGLGWVLEVVDLTRKALAWLFDTAGRTRVDQVVERGCQSMAIG